MSWWRSAHPRGHLIKSVHWKELLFVGQVRALDLLGLEASEGSILFDDAADYRLRDSMAIVLGVEKAPEDFADKRNYIQVVRPFAIVGKERRLLYRRVGSGYVLGKYLSGEATSCDLF
jgi:hypothetical protein